MPILLSRSLSYKLQLPPFRTTSTTSSNNITRLFLKLPPSCRAFHASPKPQFISAAIGTAHTALEAVHSFSGLPWAYSIPLFALLLRTTILLPISLYTRKNNMKQVALSPILQSWQPILQKETRKEVGHLGPQDSTKHLLLKTRAKRKEIYGRWGCQTWKNYLPIFQLPVFITVMEAVRQMAGAQQGWLGMIGVWSDQALTKVGAPNLELVKEVAFTPDPSLATEGALWFPNLLLADPMLVLPFVLSGSILLNLFGHKRNDFALAKWMERLKRAMGVMALMIGPIMLNVPSALLIYWISSSWTAYLQYLLLDKLMPIQPAVKACKPKRKFKSGIGRADMGIEERKV